MSISETNYSIYQHSLQHKNYINLYIQTDIYIYTVVKLYRFLVIFKHIFTLDNVDYVYVQYILFQVYSTGNTVNHFIINYDYKEMVWNDSV